MRNNHQENNLLEQAFGQVAREDLNNLQQHLEQHPLMSRQAEKLYAKNRTKMRRMLRGKPRKAVSPWWRTAAAAASLVLVLAGVSRLFVKPAEDIVLRPQTALPARVSPLPTPYTLPPAVPTDAPVETATPSPAPSPTSTPSPTPTVQPTSTPEPTPTLPAWSGAYLPKVPSGYVLEAVHQKEMSREAVYFSQEGKLMIFTEYEGKSIPLPQAGSEYSYHVLQNGATALVQKHQDGYTFTWDKADNTFILSVDAAWDKALDIANSVAPVAP